MSGAAWPRSRLRWVDDVCVPPYAAASRFREPRSRPASFLRLACGPCSLRPDRDHGCDGSTTSACLRTQPLLGSENHAPDLHLFRDLLALRPVSDPLCQLDDDPLGAADIAEPVDVPIALQLADELRAAGLQAGDEASMSSTANERCRMPGAFAGACRSPPWVGGAWNFDSSIRPWPSGVCSITISDRTPSSPTTRSTQPPSTGASPSDSSPSSTKNSVAAARSSTTMPTCSIRWIVMCSMVRTRASQRAVCRYQGPSLRPRKALRRRRRPIATVIAARPQRT